MSQFIVITHNKKTVTGAGTLLGVTMEESGVTKVISVRLENESGPPEPIADAEPYQEEEVEYEEGEELPPGVTDPSLVSPEMLRPIRGGAKPEGAVSRDSDAGEYADVTEEAAVSAS
jgi:chromosome segregation protein